METDVRCRVKLKPGEDVEHFAQQTLQIERHSRHQLLSNREANHDQQPVAMGW